MYKVSQWTTLTRFTLKPCGQNNGLPQGNGYMFLFIPFVVKPIELATHTDKNTHTHL